MKLMISVKLLKWNNSKKLNFENSFAAAKHVHIHSCRATCCLTQNGNEVIAYCIHNLLCSRDRENQNCVKIGRLTIKLKSFVSNSFFLSHFALSVRDTSAENSSKVYAAAKCQCHIYNSKHLDKGENCKKDRLNSFENDGYDTCTFRTTHTDFPMYANTSKPLKQYVLTCLRDQQLKVTSLI